MSDTESIRVVYYFVKVNGWKLALLLLLSAIAVGFIYKDVIKSDLSKVLSSLGGIALFCGCTVVMVIILTFISSWFGPFGMSCVEEVNGSNSYIPSVSSLCTVEGERKFHSYDEYREYYFELAAKRQAENYDVRRDWSKTEHVIPMYVYAGVLIVYAIIRSKEKT